MKLWLIIACLVVQSIFLVYPIAGVNQCVTDKVFVQSTPTSRVIFRFQCTNGTNLNPIIPANQGSSPVEFNELDLSPNLYTTVPYTQICQFTNLYLLDLSYNRITSVTNAFTSLDCLAYLTQIDLSFNEISSPILVSDFSNTLSSRIGSLNFKNNKIPWLQSQTFFKSDGSSRFPKLYYLGLARNNLTSIDLLWPMTMPNSNLRVELNNNPIGSLVNPLRSKFVNNVFIPMTGNRYVDLRNTSLTSLDDTALLQYGLSSAEDFKNFLFKISNYDFRGTKFNCICPANTGLYTVYWFDQFSNSRLNPSALIYQLTCSNRQGDYIFDFTCQFIGTSSTQITLTLINQSSASSTLFTNNVQTKTLINTLTASTILNTTTTAQITTTVRNTTSVLVVNSIGQLIGGETAALSPRISNNDNNLYLLFLLIVPVLLILIFLFMCCYGRLCLTFLYNSCSISICGCFRPDSKNSTTKLYDVIICYNQLDENWIDQRFMPFFGEICKKSKCAKLTLFASGAENSSLKQVDIDKLKSSKRIILIITKKFLNQEWTNKSFRQLLSEINRQDQYCSIILINLSEIDEDQLVQITKDIELRNNIGSIAKFKNAVANNMKFNCGLRDVECLDWHESNFWAKLNYLMPHRKLADQMAMAAPKDSKSVQGKTDSPEPNDSEDPGTRRDSILVENEHSLVTRLKKINEAKRVTPVNKDDLIADFGAVVKDDDDNNFWSSLVITKSDFNYEPVGLAGSTVSGNREANLNRFGVPITHSLLAIDRVSFRKMPTNNSNRVSSSSSGGGGGGGVRLNNAESDQPSGRIVVPTEFLSREATAPILAKEPEKLKIKETDKARNVKAKTNKKKKDDENEVVVGKPKKINSMPSESPRKDKISSGKTAKQRNDDIECESNNSNQNDSDDILIKKPKKRVMISTDLNTEKKYNLSSEDNKDVLSELEAYMNNEMTSSKMKKKKSGKKVKQAKNEDKEKVVNKDVDDDYLYDDFEID